MGVKVLGFHWVKGLGFRGVNSLGSMGVEGLGFNGGVTARIRKLSISESKQQEEDNEAIDIDYVRQWTMYRCMHPGRGRGPAARTKIGHAWEFRDVVFEDVGFEHHSLLTLSNWRCGDFTPKADMGEGFKASFFKPHILKHHIPEHPTCVGLRTLGSIHNTIDTSVCALFNISIPTTMTSSSSSSSSHVHTHTPSWHIIMCAYVMSWLPYF